MDRLFLKTMRPRFTHNFWNALGSSFSRYSLLVSYGIYCPAALWLNSKYSLSLPAICVWWIVSRLGFSPGLGFRENIFSSYVYISWVYVAQFIPNGWFLEKMWQAEAASWEGLQESGPTRSFIHQGQTQTLLSELICHSYCYYVIFLIILLCYMSFSLCYVYVLCFVFY